MEFESCYWLDTSLIVLSGWMVTHNVVSYWMVIHNPMSTYKILKSLIL